MVIINKIWQIACHRLGDWYTITSILAKTLLMISVCDAPSVTVILYLAHAFIAAEFCGTALSAAYHMLLLNVAHAFPFVFLQYQQLQNCHRHCM